MSYTWDQIIPLYGQKTFVSKIDCLELMGMSRLNLSCKIHEGCNIACFCSATNLLVGF